MHSSTEHLARMPLGKVEQQAMIQAAHLCDRAGTNSGAVCDSLMANSRRLWHQYHVSHGTTRLARLPRLLQPSPFQLPKQVDVCYHASTADWTNGLARTYGSSDTIEFPDILPQFTCAVTELFE